MLQIFITYHFGQLVAFSPNHRHLFKKLETINLYFASTHQRSYQTLFFDTLNAVYFLAE